MPYVLPDAIVIIVKSKKVDLLFELEKSSLDQWPRNSWEWLILINRMALVRKIKGDGQTFNQVGDDLFRLVLSTGFKSVWIDVITRQPTFKKTLETKLLASGITFLGNSTNKTKLVKFLASQLRK